MSDKDRLRSAAMVISDLIATRASDDKEFAAGRRELYSWERDGMQWIKDQLTADPETPINAWAAEAMRRYGFAPSHWRNEV